MSKYPSDEFDRVPEFTDRQGVHRIDAGLVPVKRGGLWPLIVFGVAALVIGVIAFSFLRPQFGAELAAGEGASPSASASTSQNDGEADGSASPSETADESDPAEDSTEPSESDSNESTGTDSAEASDSADATAGTVDYTAPVGVYNASTVGGLAGQNAGILRGAGFTQVITGNWPRQVVPTVVYYKGSSSAATARAVADSLGVATIYQTENIPLEISVVLGSGG